MTTMTAYALSARAAYVNRKELTHSEYYSLLVERLGEDALRAMLPCDRARTPEEWRALIEDDHHLNNVPLRKWDAMHPYVVTLVRSAGGTDKLSPIIGTGGWSLSDSACVLKETARRYAGVIDHIGAR